MSLFGAFWDKDPNPVGTENFGNNRGLFYNLNWTPKGVLHVGAWDAWEAKQYAQYCGSNVVFLEAHPKSYETFKSEIEKHQQKIFNYAAWNIDDLEMDLYCPPNNQDSSSLIFKNGHSIKTNTITLKSLFQRNSLNFSDFDLLNVDTEGAEIQVLEGLGDEIINFKYVLLEISDLGSSEKSLLNDYMNSKNFSFFKDSTSHISSVTRKRFCDRLFRNNL